MPQQTMYPAVVNSPVTELASPIDDTQDTISLVNAYVLPAAPNLAVIGNGENAETILYTGVDGNDLTGVTRGFQGTAAAWVAGAKVARYFTAYDHNTFKTNIEDHENRITGTEAQLAQNQSQQATIAQGLQIITTDQDTPVWMKRILGKHVVNHVPLFDSGLWTLHANVTVDSPTKITHNASAVEQSDIYSTVKSSTAYTLSLVMNTNAKADIVWLDSSDVVISQTSAVIGDGTLKSLTVTSPTNTAKARVRLYTPGAGNFTFEDVMLNEGSSAEGFVANLKPLAGLYVKRYGKNLAPTLVSEWEQGGISGSTGQNATVTTTIRTVGYFTVAANTQHRVSAASGYVFNTVLFYDSDKNFISFVASPSTFTTPSNARYARATLAKQPTATFESHEVLTAKPMLNLGSTALTYEPQNNDEFYLAHPTFGDPVTGVRDVVEEVDGKLMLTKRWESKVLDGSLGWAFGADYLGFKTVTVSGYFSNRTYGSGTLTLVKYNGKIAVDGTSYTAADMIHNNAASLTISIADTDSGFGGTYAMTTNDIKAVMNGWRGYKVEGGIGVVYDGSNTKGFYNIYNSSDTTQDVNVCLSRNTHAENGKKGYQLTYQLAIPEVIELVEGVDWFGSVSLHEGDNLVEMGEAAIYKEAVTPILVSGKYYIGYTGSGETTDYRIEKAIEAYKNSAIDSGWTIETIQVGGKERFSIPEADFDPTAQYFVTYIAQSYQISAQAVEAEIVYATNLRSVVARNVQDMADVKQDVSDLAWAKANRFQEKYIAPTLLAGAVRMSSSDQFGYYKDEFGMVHVNMAIDFTTAPASLTTFMRFPEGYRPGLKVFADGLTYSTSSDQTAFYGYVKPDGEFQAYLTGNKRYVILNFSFRAEQ